MTLLIREVRPGDVERVSVLMREVDRAECRAAGQTPWQSLNKAVALSALSWTGELKGWPHAIFGVVSGSAVTGLGHPWFLGSNDARRQQRAFLRVAPGYLGQIELMFPRLTGQVSQRNVAAIRWLRRMGFVVEDRWSFLRGGEPMFDFRKGF